MPKITAKSDSAIPLSSSSSNNTTISIISSESDDITSINLLNTLGIGPALLQQYIKLLNSLLRNNTLSISHLIRLLTELESGKFNKFVIYIERTTYLDRMIRSR